MISYNEKEISAYCDDGGLCAFGNYSIEGNLSFTLQHLHTGAITQLRSVDPEWQFYGTDAPSVDLRFQMSDGKLGGRVLLSDVTQTNHCKILKVCLSSRVPDFDTLAPLGVLLIAQNSYAAYCSRPRIYQF